LLGNPFKDMDEAEAEALRNKIKALSFNVADRLSESECILTGEEYRILKANIIKQDRQNFQKKFAPEVMDDGGISGDSLLDLEEEAEQYIEKFPTIAKKLFECLDVKVPANDAPEDDDGYVEAISNRFTQLANTFTLDHSNLVERYLFSLNHYNYSLFKMKRLTNKLLKIGKELEEGIPAREPMNLTKVHEEDIRMLKHIAQDLFIYTEEVAKSSRRLGMIEIETRTHKLIEVMILYARALKNIKEGGSNNGVAHFVRQAAFLKRQSTMEDLSGPSSSNLVEQPDPSSNSVKTYTEEMLTSLLGFELYWPWSWEDTVKTFKQCFSIVLIIGGVAIILRALVFDAKSQSS